VAQAVSKLAFVAVSTSPQSAVAVAAWRCLLLFSVCCALLAGGTEAASLAVVLSDNSAPYQETADAIEARLGKEHTVVKILVTNLGRSETALGDAKKIITVGVKATQAIAERHGRTPILAILIPRAWYEAEGKAALAEGGREAGAIFIDQPYSRQFHLIRSALPAISRVGMVLGKQGADQLPELDRQAKAHQLILISALLEDSPKLVQTLGKVLTDAEILLLPFPDSEVLTRASAQSIFMTSYRYRDPVVGYSQSLSSAGALLSLYSTPSQIGQQAAEVIEHALNGGKVPTAVWPQYFSVSVNEHVARSLGINIPPETTLLKRVMDAEAHD
jgi:putative tryptophan/tyrosine transport system substrate-binding protein